MENISIITQHFIMKYDILDGFGRCWTSNFRQCSPHFFAYFCSLKESFSFEHNTKEIPIITRVWTGKFRYKCINFECKSFWSPTWTRVTIASRSQLQAPLTGFRAPGRGITTGARPGTTTVKTRHRGVRSPHKYTWNHHWCSALPHKYTWNHRWCSALPHKYTWNHHWCSALPHKYIDTRGITIGVLHYSTTVEYGTKAPLVSGASLSAVQHHWCRPRDGPEPWTEIDWWGRWVDKNRSTADGLGLQGGSGCYNTDMYGYV